VEPLTATQTATPPEVFNAPSQCIARTSAFGSTVRMRSALGGGTGDDAVDMAAAVRFSPSGEAFFHT